MSGAPPDTVVPGSTTAAADTRIGHLADAAATDALAQALAATQPAQTVMVHLQGDLGAGKSSLARAWLRALGVSGPVRSPTYTLIERYPLVDSPLVDGPLVDGREALHLDLYRIGDAGELEFLGLDDVDAALWLVEWPQRGASALPPPDLRVALWIEGEGRGYRLEPCTAAGEVWLARLAALL